MPFTPFHFGPGAAIHAIAPKKISFLAFCTANVLIDIEPLYYIRPHQYPLHQFFHTYIGASLVAIATFLLFVAARRFAAHFWLPNPFKWQELGFLPIALGAAVGTYSHIVLDSFMHSDITPLAPFSDSNPLLQVVSLATLHWLCVGSGVAALCLLGFRQLLRGKNAR